MMDTPLKEKNLARYVVSSFYNRWIVVFIEIIKDRNNTPDQKIWPQQNKVEFVFEFKGKKRTNQIANVRHTGEDIETGS